MPPDQRSRHEGPGGDASAEHGPLGGQGAVDVRTGRGRVDGVDEPCLERSGVERAEDARQQGRGEEGPERLGDDEHRARHDVDDRRGHEDRPSPEGISEAARRQLEEEDGEAHRRRHRQGLRHRQSTLELPQGRQADHEPDGEPAGEAQHEQDAACRARGEDGIRLLAAFAGNLAPVAAFVPAGGLALAGGHQRAPRVGGRSRSSG
jgi:hypothetical protein